MAEQSKNNLVQQLARFIKYITTKAERERERTLSIYVNYGEVKKRTISLASNNGIDHSELIE